jgi:DNA-directed RNA polymerase subunit RPC12/RpoP
MTRTRKLLASASVAAGEAFSKPPFEQFCRDGLRRIAGSLPQALDWPCDEPDHHKPGFGGQCQERPALGDQDVRGHPLAQEREEAAANCGRTFEDHDRFLSNRLDDVDQRLARCPSCGSGFVGDLLQ